MSDGRAYGVIKQAPGLHPQQSKKPVCSATELRNERRKLAYSWLRGVPITNLAKIVSRQRGETVYSFQVEAEIREELRGRKPAEPVVIPLVRRAA